jgi:predicted phage terminase large subunit-like protein
MRGSAFQTVAPSVRINEEKGSEKEWETNKNGGVLAVGVGSGLTGRGADYIIVDDPIKDAEEAQSATILQGVWEWYTTVVRTRLQPGGAIVFVMTRWSEDDLVGRVLRHAQRSPHAEPIYRLRLPAIAEPNDPIGRKEGEALWSDYPIETLLDVQSLDPKNFQALYQQNPRTDDTIHFDISKIALVDKHYSRMCRSWDLAITEHETSDYTVGALVSGQEVEIKPESRKVILESGLTLPYKVHVHDLIRNRATFPKQRELIIETAIKDGRKVPVILEKSTIVLAACQQLKHDLEELGFDVHLLKPKGDKVARKTALETVCHQGNLSFAPGDWNHLALEEFDHFPVVDHDDQVDAVEQAHTWLSKYSDFDKDWIETYLHGTQYTFKTTIAEPISIERVKK